MDDHKQPADFLCHLFFYAIEVHTKLMKSWSMGWVTLPAAEHHFSVKNGWASLGLRKPSTVT